MLFSGTYVEEHEIMMNFKKRTGVFVAAFVVVMLSAAAAFAYWTTTGSGTDTVDTGTSAPITVNQTALATPLAPGVAPQGLKGTFTNTTGKSLYISTVTASITSVTPVGTNVCAVSNYLLTNPESTVNASIPAGTAVAAWGTTDTPMISFANSTTVNQDGCKGATVNISYVAA